VDTHYDPDPQTSHDQGSAPVSAKEVLSGVLHNEGADVAAHDMIRRELAEAEGIERLSAEYLTLAALAQQPRWDALLTRSGLRDGDLAAVRTGAGHGPLLAAFREADARGLDIETAFPQLVAGRSLADAADVAAALHGRVERWTRAAGGRSRVGVIAGLIPRAQGVSDPEMARALAERDLAMEQRARALAEQAVKSGEPWVEGFGTPPATPAHRERWLREVSTVAAYRDRWHISGQSPLGEREWWAQHGANGSASASTSRRHPGDGSRRHPNAAPDRPGPGSGSRGALGNRAMSRSPRARRGGLPVWIPLAR
jgi:hypothetical protein